MAWRDVMAALMAAAVLAPPAGAQDVVSPEAATGRSESKGGQAKSYMVAAANPLAAAAGAAILKAGGTAADAAVTVQLMLNMVEPQSSGIGGGAFLLHWDARGEQLASYDGRETAPAAATERRFLRADGSVMDRMTAVVGGHSVGVPGVLRALELAHRKHGKLPWADLVAPAIKLAEDGFEMSPRLHQLLGFDRTLRTIEPAKSFYYQADGSPKPVGTVLRNPAFAQTLRAIAAGGADAFYTGTIADDIIHAVTTARNPGDLTREDLAAYTAIERPPVCGKYRGHKVCGMGPPSAGGIGVIQSLAVIERFDLQRYGASAIPTHHLMVEASRLALADREVYIADPDVVPVPTEALLARDYLKQRSALLSVDKRMDAVEAGTLPVKAGLRLGPAGSPELPSTSHFSIVDRFGNAVAMTTSVENSFGSRLMVDGFILNNTLTDFSFDDVAAGKTVANRVGPNKRPRSSMAPTMVFAPNGKLEMVVGSPGGPAIPAFVVKTLVAMIDWDMTPEEATAAPHVIGFGRGLTLEPPLADAKPRLEAMGHSVRIGEFPSGVHAIRIGRRSLLGGADPRREGAVAGE